MFMSTTAGGVSLRSRGLVPSRPLRGDFFSEKFSSTQICPRRVGNQRLDVRFAISFASRGKRQSAGIRLTCPPWGGFVRCGVFFYYLQGYGIPNPLLLFCGEKGEYIFHVLGLSRNRCRVSRLPPSSRPANLHHIKFGWYAGMTLITPFLPGFGVLRGSKRPA